MYRASYGGNSPTLRAWGDKQTKRLSMPEMRVYIPSTFDVPIIRDRIRHTLQIVTRDPEVCDLRRESPMRSTNKKRPCDEWGVGTNVLVSCMSIHVRMSSIPVAQSRWPTFDSSSGRGGTLTFCARDPERVAPRRRFPPKKHTRKSCFGVSRHELICGRLLRMIRVRLHELTVPFQGPQSYVRE